MLATWATAMADGVVTLTTSKAVGDEVELIAYCATTDQAFKVDWGDGTLTSYNVDPNGWGYSQRITAPLKGQTIKISGPITYLQMQEAGLTSADFKDEGDLKKIDLQDNELATVTFDNSLTAVTDIDLSNNKLTALAMPAMPKLANLNLNYNEIDSHELDLSPLADNLEILKVANNKLVTLNLISFVKLKQFYAPNNPDLTTAVFADGNANLTSIDMSNCYVMHFYGISLPNLTELQLSNNALMSFTEGTHDYPKLSTLSLSNNYLEELDVTHYPKLYSLYCNGNKLTSINVSMCTELATLNCAKNQLTKIDLSQNEALTAFYCDSNRIDRIDLSHQPKISTLSVSGNPVTYVDLTKAYYLREFRAADTKCSSFYFNYVNPWGQFQYIDVRNNPNLTSSAINCMFKTLPECARKYGSSPNLLIAGSNGEHSDPSYPTSDDLEWVLDVEGDATATNDDVAVTLLNATDTGEKETVTGQYGGMTSDQTFTFTKYRTEHGTFTVSQWSGAYYQQLADVTTTAKTGVPIHITATPDEGYSYEGVKVNGQTLPDEWFTVNGEATIEPIFGTGEKSISLTVAEGQSLSFALGAAHNDTPIAIDWGNGSKQQATLTTKWTRFDGTAAGTTITIYGDVTAANFESWGDYGLEMGLWDNKFESIDLTKNPNLVSLNLYMNPIGKLDVSNQTQLEELDCSYCELTDLDVSHNEALTILRAYGNELTELDVTHNPKLTELNAKVNELYDVDLSANTELTELNLASNQLESIDLSKLTKLRVLYLNSNWLEEIDLKHNTELYDLVLSKNMLTDLDLSANQKLNYLSFNENDIHLPDLSSLPLLRTIDCGGNGMSACEMDDFYYLLPQRYTQPSEEEEKATTLTVLTGNETTPNDAYNADGAIATAKGWTLNIAGNASGCDKAYIFVKQTAHGTIKLFDKDGMEIISGDKTAKNSPIRVEATPDDGYELTELKANGLTVDTESFEITRLTEVVPTFAEATAVSQATAQSATITGGQGFVSAELPATGLIEVRDLQGKLVHSATARQLTLPLDKGSYVVTVKCGTTSRTEKVVVR